MSQQQQYDTDWVSAQIDALAADAERRVRDHDVPPTEAVHEAVLYCDLDLSEKAVADAINSSGIEKHNYSTLKEAAYEARDDVDTVALSALNRLYVGTAQALSGRLHE